MFLFKKMRTGQTLNDKGFSLIEVLIAISVLAIGLLAISSLSISSSSSNGKSKRLTQAAILAEKQVEDLLNTPYASMGDNGGPLVVDTRYTITWTAGAPANNMRNVSVTVTWPEGTLQRSITLDFIKHDST